MAKEVKTVGVKEGLGAGVFGLGLLALFLPGTIQKIADLEFIASDAFSMLSGSLMTLGVFILIAGVVIMFAKLDD